MISLTQAGREFVRDYHLATLSTMAPSGSIHVVAVGFTVHEGMVRVITRDRSQKVRNVERDGRATVGQVSGPQWLSIAGRAWIERDPEAVRLAERLYAERYRPPRENPERVVIVIEPIRSMGSAGLLER